MSKRKTPPVPAGHKWCLGCEAGLPLDQFEIHRHRPDGHEARCRPCLAEQRRMQKECRGIVRAAAERMMRASRELDPGGKMSR